MFAKESDELVEKLVDAEYRNAVNLLGATYPSKDGTTGHEALSEEVSEAYNEAQNMYDAFIANDLNSVKSYVNNAIKELAQVRAVIKKIESIEAENE